MNSVDLEAIRFEVIALSALRQRVVKENDTVGRLFASLRQDTTIPPSWDDLQRAETALQKKVPGFHLWYVPQERAYTLLPDLEYKPAPETHSGVCSQCERNVTALSPAGLCEGCTIQAMIESEQQ